MATPCLPALLLFLIVSIFSLCAYGDDPLPSNFWDPVVQYLDGSDWTLENANRSIRLSNVTVPGSVWTALLTDPLYGYNERDYQWINHEPYWHLSKVFAPNQSLWYDFVTWNTELVLEGVDTLSRVLINGIDVGFTDQAHQLTTTNMFRRYTFQAPLFDNSQFNHIDIYLYPVAPYIDTAAAAYPYPIPAIDPVNIESNRSFVRKPTSDFGWDFAPHFMSMGVWKSIVLRSFNQGWIQDVTVRQKWGKEMTQTERDQWGMSGNDFLLNVTAFVRTPPHNSSGVLTVQVAGQSTSLPVAFPATPVNSGDYLHTASLLLPIPSPTLWWPHTHGQPFLYNLTVTFNSTPPLSPTLIQTYHSTQRQIGFRSIRVVREPTPNSPGLSFQFVVNGVKVFMKGSNLTPFDPFHYRVSEANISRVLSGAVEANMNMVRVWGGGLYQSDLMYDWADRHGLLVFQEVAFACQMAPVNDQFLQSVREEVSQQARRLSSHPSLAMIGGNNEIEEALDWFPPTQQNRDRYLVDYNQLYVNTVRDAVVREVGLDTEFVTSSPSNGPLSLDPYVQRWGQPGDYTFGDTHFYPDPTTQDFADAGTWPRTRFLSEFGFPSFTSRHTLHPIAPNPSTDIVVNSTFIRWRARYSDPDSNWITTVNRLEMSKHFHLPTTTNASLYYDDFTFLSQANQALAYSTAFQSMRRQMSESPSYTSGVLAWQLEDIWQAGSYAMMEYGGRWKAVMHAAKRDFAQKLVSGYVYPVKDGESAECGVYVVNDGMTPIKGELTVQVKRWSTGQVMVNHTVPYQCPELAAAKVFSHTVQQLLNGTCAMNECYVNLQASWSDGVNIGQTTNVVYLTSLVNVDLPRPVYNVELLKEPKVESVYGEVGGLVVDGVVASTEFPLAELRGRVGEVGLSAVVSLTVQVNVTSPFTFFETSIPGRWSDNSVFMQSNVRYSLTFTADEPIDVDHFLTTITIRDVYTTYHRS